MRIAFEPVVSDEIWRQYPEYRALSVTVRGFRAPDVALPESTQPSPPAWLNGHLEAWRAAFRNFGANPKKTPCSVEALWRRLEKTGALPAINPIVDLYNSLSIRFGAPFGGEDTDSYEGIPHLVLATGTEQFDTLRDGAPVIEYPDRGEVVWRDDRGLTCRRWNWRQCRRTALSASTTNIWFVIDRLPPMPMQELIHAGEALTLGLHKLCPDVETSAAVLEPRS
jgi:DNA/RNA-binding domain of Phe-tRNA-synthetase-like protein